MARDNIYLLFPLNSLPTQDEVDIFNGFIAYLKDQYHVGTHMRSNALAIEFDRKTFEHARKADFNFEVLITAWLKHGAEIEYDLPFLPAQDDKTLPVRPKEEYKPTPKEIVRSKKMDAAESIARSRLAVQQSVQRTETFKGAAKAVPYALVGLGSMLTAAAGYKAYTALQNSGMEPRKDTIQRLIEEEDKPKNSKKAERKKAEADEKQPPKSGKER